MVQGGEPGGCDSKSEAIGIVTLWCLSPGTQTSPRAVTFRDLVEALQPDTR